LVKQLPLQQSQLDQLIERMEAVQPDPPSFGTPVGCSRATGRKHPVYLGIVKWFVTMHTTSVRKGRLFLMGETHAGPAWYLNSTTDDLTVGSPLIDLDVLDTHKLFTDEGYRYKAVFCDRGKPRAIIQQLRYAIEAGGFGTGGEVDVLHGPFEEVLPPYLDALHGKGLCGVLFVDANGSMSRAMVEMFQTYAYQLRYVDICIWHQANVRRRFNGLHPTATQPGGAWYSAFQKYDYRPLRELLPDLGKRRWLIRKPFNVGNGTAWTMLVGSNWDKLPEWRAGEMYRLDSPMGQAILTECDG
jgi:hypothetical protein